MHDLIWGSQPGRRTGGVYRVIHGSDTAEADVEEFHSRQRWRVDQIDAEGFRANVGIIVCDARRFVLVGGRVGQEGWQFPQGGIQPDESPEQAMYRELREEIGLHPEDVAVLGSTPDWLRYHLPDKYLRRRTWPLCIGQKQRWFLLQLLSADSSLQLDTTSKPEFDRWRWVDYWQPLREVIYFKRGVYRQALQQLGPIVFPEGLPPLPDGIGNGDISG